MSKAITLRVPDDDLAEIDRRASNSGLTRTGYMIRLALGEGLPPTVEDDMAELRERLERVEAVQFGA